jgi:hypothetical protein
LKEEFNLVEEVTMNKQGTVRQTWQRKVSAWK